MSENATEVGHIRSLAFLAPGNFADDDPYTGLEATLQLFEDADKAGWDGAWIRQRHLEHGVGSAAVFLAAAGQRTQHIELGTAVIPIGYESPFRLAEDLSLADVLSRGRLHAGFSSSMPHADPWRSRLRRRLAQLRPQARAQLPYLCRDVGSEMRITECGDARRFSEGAVARGNRDGV